MAKNINKCPDCIGFCNFGKFPDCKNKKIEEEKYKLIAYMTYHYKNTWAEEKDLIDAMNKDGWFDMSVEEIKRRYGEQIKKNMVEMEEKR